MHNCYIWPDQTGIPGLTDYAFTKVAPSVFGNIANKELGMFCDNDRQLVQTIVASIHKNNGATVSQVHENMCGRVFTAALKPVRTVLECASRTRHM